MTKLEAVVTRPERDQANRSGVVAREETAKQHGVMMRGALALTVFLAAIAGFGCGVQQPTIASKVAEAPPRPLPFKGRLIGGDPGELPPAVAMSLSNASTVTFSYREELTHDEYHIPLVFSALNPVTYLGSPLGDYGVTAFASLSIMDGDRVLGDYTAKAHISKSYNLYSEPTHRELEQAARAAVRERIDQKLHRDADRLAQAIANSGQPPTGPVAK